MKSLIIVAHGSRREASNQEVRAITGELQATLLQNFDRVACAFLELTEPGVSAQIDAEVAAGATQVTLFPYFLAAGSHVSQDLPELLAQAEQRHPQVAFVSQAHLGKLPGLVECIAQSLRAD